MIVLGIDPGSRITGYGFIHFENNKATYIASGYLKLTNSRTQSLLAKNQMNAEPLAKIFKELKLLIQEYQPDQFAIEEVFVNKNVNSALKLGQARGAAIVTAASFDLPVYEYTAKQIKQAVVGYGNADKNQVQQMIKMLLRLKEVPQSDEADGLAVAMCHAFSCRHIEY